MKKRVCVLGAGFSGLSAATVLASKGYEVILVEQHDQVGGRARRWSAQGFTFDMGPSWYWMPDVIERYFARFNKSPKDYFKLIRLDPSYRVFFEEGVVWDIPAGTERCASFFEQIEKGSGRQLTRFLARAQKKYALGMQDIIYRPSISIKELASPRLLFSLLSFFSLSSMRSHVARYFRDQKLRQLMEFPVLFLGAVPQRTPAFYSLMNYADTELGTWYPMGGMYELVRAMRSLAEEQGVTIRYNSKAEAISVNQNRARYIHTTQGKIEADLIICATDYQHGEQLLPEAYRSYSPKYWASRKMAPSSLIYYIGLSKKLRGLLHHNLFFDQPYDDHLRSIYTKPCWPEAPLFYACMPSGVDPSVAPPGGENLFLLVPVAAGLSDTPALRSSYYQSLIRRLEARTGESIEPFVVYQKSYAASDFIRDYHAYKGNAYGLANTLGQTATGRPSLRSRKVGNLFFCGQLTVPGPGVPPTIVSGQVAAAEVMKHYAL